MTDPRRVALALLLLRVTLGVFMLQWAVEKFVVPATTSAIFRNFYGMDVGGIAVPVLGVLQVALSLALLLGVQPRLSYGIATLLHAVTVIVTIPRLLNPWNPVSNHTSLSPACRCWRVSSRSTCCATPTAGPCRGCSGAARRRRRRAERRGA